MKTVGFVGWRGMVGSVLLDRMASEGDFGGYDPVFFSTSQAGQRGPDVGGGKPLRDANDVRGLAEIDIVVTCQGGDYTRSVHGALRESGWNGYWIDAASALRMNDTSVVILDPVNRRVIDEALEDGTRDFIGGNCTVSLMLMGLQGLFDRGWVEWMTCMTYQSASGAGARHMIELVRQMGDLASGYSPGQTALEIERLVTGRMACGDLPPTTSACRWPAVSSPGSTGPWTTARRARSGRRRTKPTRSWAAAASSPSTDSASGSGRCGATARR